jgi:hypothetical protein
MEAGPRRRLITFSNHFSRPGQVPGLFHLLRQLAAPLFRRSGT